MADEVKPLDDWRPVVGWEGWYEVSALGNVRRVAKSHSPGRRQASGILRPYTAGAGYPSIRLYRRGEKPVRATVHRLVADAFLGPKPAGMEINHKDGRKTNNAVSNLEWTTRGDNVRHSVVAGLHRPGRHSREKGNG